MKNLFTFLFVACAVSSLLGSNVTFKVDMNGNANFDPAVDSLTVFGSFNSWSTTTDILKDIDTDGVYEVTLDLTVGESYEYKYVIVDGDGVEDVFGDVSGSAAYAGTNNRAIYIPENDIILETVTFASCYGVNNNMVSVVFQVDMSSETVSSNGVYVTGDFSGKAWWTDAFSFNESLNGIYLDTINLLPNATLNYKYINGNNWDGQETTIPNEVKYSDNRGGTVPALINQYYLLPLTPFNGSPALYDVTFDISGNDGQVNNPSIHVFNRTITIYEGTDTTISLAKGFYPYTISAVTYYDKIGDFLVEALPEDISVVLKTAFKAIDLSINDSTGVAPNSSFKITSSHPLTLPDGSEVNNTNVSNLVTFTQDGTDVDFFATINPEKTEITLIPNVLLLSNTIYKYGIDADVLIYNDGDLVKESIASFTTKIFDVDFITYQDFDGNNDMIGFYAKVADDHVGATAQPYYTASPASSSNKALLFTKGTGSWGGWGKLQMDLSNPINTSVDQIISFDVYASKACKVRVALTDIENSEGQIQVETGEDAPADVYITKVNEWQTIYVDFTEGDFDDTASYQHILMCFDAGVDEDNTFYIDNIKGPKLDGTVSFVPEHVTEEITIFPNPADDLITVSADNDINQIEIYDLSGTLVNRTSSLSTANVTINTSALSQGMYFVKVEGKDLNITSSIFIR